jgi:hypothetical protein
VVLACLHINLNMFFLYRKERASAGCLKKVKAEDGLRD